jgi:DNA-binding CsgD family transcriptional regulator
VDGQFDLRELMSQNESKTTPKLRQKERLNLIEKRILFKSQEEIALELGVSRSTIERDIERWRNKGGFKRFLYKEFFPLYGQEKLVNPSRALDRIMYLLGKEMEQEPENVKASILKVIAPWDNKFSQPTTTSLTQDKDSSTTAPQDTDRSLAVVDGAKTTALSMKP